MYDRSSTATHVDGAESFSISAPIITVLSLSLAIFATPIPTYFVHLVAEIDNFLVRPPNLNNEATTRNSTLTHFVGAAVFPLKSVAFKHASISNTFFV